MADETKFWNSKFQIQYGDQAIKWLDLGESLSLGVFEFVDYECEFKV